LLGPYLSRLLGGESAVGVVTFARFYGLHTLLLPPATLLLIGIHVYLVRRHGVAAAPGDEIRPKRKFYPEQAFRDTVAIFVAFAVLFTLAVVARVPLERLADPTDTSYIPRPEWYFLFLFETLKFIQGPLEAVGAVGLPALAILALILVPFVDRGRLERVTRRTVAVAVVVLAAVAWTGLTVAAVATTPKPDVAEIDFSGPTDWMQLSPEELAGLGYFQLEHCDSCHTMGGGEKPKMGPDLATTRRKSAAWMIDHFKRPSALVPGSPMPPIQLTNQQLNALAAFLLKVNRNNAESLMDTPAFAVHGAMVYQGHGCGACHMVNGVGMKIGPPLNGLDKRRNRDWVVKHFLDPKATSPGTIMPPYKLPQQEMDDLTSYLLSLPE
jgi:ubiquinol-cytochrome c reductase cytochrome b subunit